MVTKKFWFGVFIGILGVVLFSSKAVMVKLAYQYEVDAITMLLLRMLFSFPFYVVIAYLYRNENQGVEITKKEYSWVLFFGLVGYYSGSSEFAINGTYTYEVEERSPGGVLLVQEVFSVDDPVALKSSVGEIHTSIGGSLKLSHYVSATVAYHMAKNNSLAFNLRFYINNGED